MMGARRGWRRRRFRRKLENFLSLLTLVSFRSLVFKTRRLSQQASVRTPEHIDRVDAGLFLPCTNLAQDAKMASPARPICGGGRRLG
jgi:hypothetical protein